VLNIPRDSYVKISGTDIYDKINHAYYYGYNSPPDGVEPHLSGINTTLGTIQDFLGGVPIHEYVAIDMDGAASIIDEIGGIYFDVELVIRAPTADRRVLVDKGYQLLDGEKFMYYVRYRGGGGGGEWGRNDRQQEIMIEFFKQLKSESRFMNIPGLYRNLNRFIETDINLGQIAALSMFAAKIDADEIKRYIFSGRGQLSYRDGQNIWYLVTDEEERIKIIKEVFDIDVEKRVIPPLPAPFIYTPYESDPIYVGEPE
jgi:polyisoprenyl-teichoic acid--peptidoglycan teichoic acid transferase